MLTKREVRRIAREMMRVHEISDGSIILCNAENFTKEHADQLARIINGWGKRAAVIHQTGNPEAVFVYHRADLEEFGYEYKGADGTIPE